MSNDLLLLVKSMAHVHKVSDAIVLSAIEDALSLISKEPYGEASLMRVVIDPDTGLYETFRCWRVVADEDSLEIPEQEMLLPEAHEINSELQVDDIVEEQVESVSFGRINARKAGQLIKQKVRDAQRVRVAEQYQERLGCMMIGLAKRVTREAVFLDMGDTDAILKREDMIPNEAIHINDRVRVVLVDVSSDHRGPQLQVSRTSPALIQALFGLEVPEVAEEVIEIKAAARDPGLRAKIAVKTNDKRIDPIGACVGMRGSRVQAISNELRGERVDIVLWDDNPAQLVINAISPAEVVSILVDEAEHSIDIAVDEDQLSQAIGRGGQNVRLASELTGWTLNVMSVEKAELKHTTEAHSIKNKLMIALDIEDDLAQILTDEGFACVEEVAQVDTQELLDIDDFDEGTVTELQTRARNFIKEKAHKKEAKNKEALSSLMSIEGVDQALALQLIKLHVTTRDDLAELAVDDLLDKIELDETEAAQLIMRARAHWFQDE